MSAFTAILAREIRLMIRSGGAGLSFACFALIILLLPLAAGSEPALLAKLGPGFIWIAALLSQLLTLERLVQSELEDGTLDLMMGASLSLEYVFAAKALAQCVMSALSAILFGVCAGVLFKLPAITPLALSLLVGLPGLSAISATIAALTAGVRRGSLLIALLVLPLAIPFLIFGVKAAEAGGTGLVLLIALSLFSLAIALILGPAALRTQN